MTKKVFPKVATVTSIEHAVALHLVLECPNCTTKQRLSVLLTEVRKLIADRNLTLQKMKEALKKWFEEGWAMITKDILQVTRAGRNQIKKLAEEASAPPSMA